MKAESAMHLREGFGRQSFDMHRSRTHDYIRWSNHEISSPHFSRLLRPLPTRAPLTYVPLALRSSNTLVPQAFSCKPSCKHLLASKLLNILKHQPLKTSPASSSPSSSTKVRAFFMRRGRSLRPRILIVFPKQYIIHAHCVTRLMPFPIKPCACLGFMDEIASHKCDR